MYDTMLCACHHIQDSLTFERQSLIDPAMNWSSYVTTIDIAGELFGLSTLFLGVDFYSRLMWQ